MSPETGTMSAPSFIETAEPKTLTLEQLSYARKAALHVLRTRSPEEAMRIFTEGLVPVMGVREFSSSSTTPTDSSSDDDVELDSCEDYSVRHGGRHGRRRSVKRDVATAPF